MISNMDRIDRIKIAISKGYTCDPVNGLMLGPRGKHIGRKDKYGYVYVSVYIGKGKVNFNIKAHQFIWYWVNNQVVECIDHINGIKHDNRICNLRSVSGQQNKFNNKKVRGYGWHKSTGKWRAMIGINGKSIHLGCFDNEKDAYNAYQEAKVLYHII